MWAELLWFLCGNFHIFITMATGVGLTQISLTQLNRQTSKTPIWRKNLDDISYTSWVIADFLIKFTNFCYHGNKGGSSENLNDSVWSANPQNPQFGAQFWDLLNASWVIVIFVRKFQNFPYHGNRGWSDTIFTYTVKSADPKTPYLVQESWWYLLYKLSNGQFCVQMTSACCHGNKGRSNRNLSNTVWLPDPENPQFGANILHISLTVHKLWLFEVAIGRNANFQILGVKGG